jgi:putative hydrolase
MRNIVNDMRRKYPNIEILLGVEANIVGLNGDIDVKDDEIHLYDVIYVGYHYGIIPHSIGDFFNFYLSINILDNIFLTYLLCSLFPYSEFL